MIFLNKAFYNQDNNSLFGVLIDKYSKSGRGRIETTMIDAKDIQLTLKDEILCGFNLTDGMLLSDSSDYFICDEEKYKFFSDYVKALNSNNEIDLIDFLKYLIEIGAFILPDFFETELFTGKEIVSVSNLKVSESTINIYTPYIVDNMWNVFSLYDSENLEPREFYVGVPSGTLMGKYLSNISYISTIHLNNQEYDTYSCKFPIINKCDVSNSIINYLAFSIAEKKIYCNILKTFLEKASFNTHQPKIKSKPREGDLNKHKINIEIKHSLSKFKDYALAETLVDSPKEHFLTQELDISVNFIRHLKKQMDVNVPKEVIKICVPLYENLKEELLCNSLELLSIRFGLLSFLDGRTKETSYMNVEGGGVLGNTTIKRVGW